ncbi:hypothetical protein M758_UG058900 [Ceratodon purpureus]|nr:hypothetical protein M758_UG058900 [Ceratodon purpureus]
MTLTQSWKHVHQCEPQLWTTQHYFPNCRKGLAASPSKHATHTHKAEGLTLDSLPHQKGRSFPFVSSPPSNYYIMADSSHLKPSTLRNTIFKRMLPLLLGHEVSSSNSNTVGDCTTCSQEKLILHPYCWKLPTEMPSKLQGLQRDV